MITIKYFGLALFFLLGLTRCLNQGSSGSLSADKSCRFYASSFFTRDVFLSTETTSEICSFDTADLAMKCIATAPNGSVTKKRTDYESFSDFLDEVTPGLIRRLGTYDETIPGVETVLASYSYNSQTGNLDSSVVGNISASFSDPDSIGRPQKATVALLNACQGVSRSIAYSSSGYTEIEDFSSATGQYPNPVTSQIEDCSLIGTITSTYQYDSSGVLETVDVVAPHFTSASRNLYTLVSPALVCF